MLNPSLDSDKVASPTPVRVKKVLSFIIVAITFICLQGRYKKNPTALSKQLDNIFQSLTLLLMKLSCWTC